MRRNKARRLWIAAWILIVPMLAGILDSRPARADDSAVFVERFNGPASPRWQFKSTGPSSPAVRWANLDEPPGMHFVSQGVSHAHASWDVGTREFELSFELELEFGNRAAWRFPGVCLAVSSASPEQAGESDLAFCWSAHAQGLTASVRTGGVFDGAEKRPGVWQFQDRCQSPRFVLNQNGAGGHDYSVQWPDKRLDGTRVRLTMQRRNDTVRFTAYHARGGDRPWWTGSWELPESLRNTPLRHVIVKNVLNPNSYADLNEPIRDVDELRGRIEKIQARCLDGPAVPRVDRIGSDNPVLQEGSVATLVGEGFDEGTSILINGQPAGDVHRLSDTELRVTLDQLNPGAVNTLAVVHPSGLVADMPGGFLAGRTVRRVEPLEVSLEGGEVTLIGSGFAPDVTVTIGDARADVVDLIDPNRLRLRVPPGVAGPATVSVVDPSGAAFDGRAVVARAPHPYLWYTADTLDDLRSKFAEPMFADYRALILGKADGERDALGRIGQPNHAAIMHAYLWAYLMTGQAAYREKLMTAVDALLGPTDELPGGEFGSPGRRLQVLSLDEFMCHNGEAIATVYDTLFDELSPARKVAMLRYLHRHLAYYRDRLQANDWWYRNNPSNTIAVGNGCGGIVALALKHIDPDLAADTIDQAVENIRERYVAMADDGGCVEGNLYWDYGFTYQLLFGHALWNTTGDDRGLLTDAKLDRVPRFVETQLGGDGMFFTFNDTQPWLTGMAVCADFGGRFDNGLLRWLADRTTHEAAIGGTHVFTRPQFYALAFRTRDRTPSPEKFPGIPTLAYQQTLQWGVLRSDGTSFMPPLVVGIKGRDGQTTHHAQEDLGGFVLHSRGEAFLIDPGYYQPKADAHSLPLIGDKGPDSHGKTLISDAWEKGPLRTMTLDATDAYRETGVRSVRRVFVLHGDEALIVLDDIAPGADGDATVTAQYQCGFPVSVSSDHRSAAIDGRSSRVALQTFGPQIQLEAAGPIDFGRSWVFAETGVQWHQLKGRYVAKETTPLVTVLLPFTDGQIPQASVSRSSSGLTVRLPGGSSIEFEQSGTGWKLKRS